MKGSDISLGDYLVFKAIEIDEYLKKEQEVIRVKKIEFDEKNNIFIINKYPLEYYLPMLLTDEWLLYFGYSYDQTYDTWDYNQKIILERSYDDNIWLINGYIKVKYIHQLQKIENLYEIIR